MLKPLFATCAALIKTYNPLAPETCERATNYITGDPLRFNVYDIRKPCPPSLPLCYNLTNVDLFLNR